MEYSFDVGIATEYGVNEAIFIKNLHFWIFHNKANNKNHINNHTWTYNSLDAFQKLFPFWTTRQIKYIVNKLYKAGVILVKKLNTSKGDNRNWYAFKNEARWFEEEISIPKKCSENSHMVETKLSEGLRQNCPNTHTIYTDSKHKKKYIKKSFAKSENVTEMDISTTFSELKRTYVEFLSKLKNGEATGKDIKCYPRTLQSAALLAFFSHKTKKRVYPVPSNLKPLSARLNEGIEEEEIRTVMMLKYQQWKDDPKMAPYVRISTLLRPSKFYDYLSEINLN